MHTKKQFLVNILNILKKYSDADHRLSQSEIAKWMERDYNIVIGRKAVKSNLMELISLGYDIEYTEIERKSKDGEDGIVYTDWYYNHEFTEAELRFLIDYLLFTKLIPYSQRMELIDKLTDLSSIHFREKMRKIKALPEDRVKDGGFFFNLELLDEAISNEKKVSFKVLTLNTKNNPQPPAFDEKKTVSPYELVAKGGKHYLFFSEEPKRLLGYCPIESITDLHILDEPALPKKDVEWLKYSHDPILGMIRFAGEGEAVTFRTDWSTYQKFSANLLYLDKDKVVIKRKDDEITITASVKEDLMLSWAMCYGLEIISPESLKEKVRDEMKAMWSKYAISGDKSMQCEEDTV
ncbi:MAG: WYL domain-containing protein [Oscillospiraceae bacterium]|nr:WYL domain-containing protein [Oscillospiraceae bacterium]